MTMNTDLEEIAALMQLASPALPIGGYSYSQALEAAIDSTLVSDAVSAQQWIGDLFLGVFTRSEAPLWLMSHSAWSKYDFVLCAELNDYFLASRETSELRAETEQMGWSLLQLAQSLGWGGEAIKQLTLLKPLSLITAHSYACYHLGIQAHNGLTAYSFTWLENQVAAAVKAIPLGQVAGQKILSALRTHLSLMVTEAQAQAQLGLAGLSNFSPQFAILSARHETQYSRLFRS